MLINLACMWHLIQINSVWFGWPKAVAGYEALLKNPTSVEKLKELFYNDMRDAIRKLKGSPGFDDILAMNLLGSTATIDELISNLIVNVYDIFILI